MGTKYLNHIKEQIYGNLPPFSYIVKARRIQYASHCYRASNDVISSLRQIGRKCRKLTIPDVVSRDTVSQLNLDAAMQDQGIV